MRHLLNPFSLMLSTVFLVSCASAIPPARIDDYVPAERRADSDLFTRITQRPLQAGLVVVSDTAELGAGLRIFRKRRLLASERAYSRTWAVRLLWR